MTKQQYTTIENETFADVTNPANWSMTEEVKTTKTGNVSQVYRVFYKGELYTDRKTKRTYAGHWMEIINGGLSSYLAGNISHLEKDIKKNTKLADNGGAKFTNAEEYREIVKRQKAQLASTRERLAEVKAQDPAYDWRLVDGGYAGRPDLMKGNAQALIA